MKIPSENYFTFTATERRILQKLQSQKPYTYKKVTKSAVPSVKKAFIFAKSLLVKDFDKQAWYEKKGEKVVKKIYTKLYIERSNRKISTYERYFLHKIFQKIHFENNSPSQDRFHEKLATCLKILEDHPEIAIPKLDLREKTISSLISFEKKHPNAIIMDDNLLILLNEYNEKDIEDVLEYAYQLEEITKLPKDSIIKGITSFLQTSPNQEHTAYEKSEALHDAILKAFQETCTKEQIAVIDLLKEHEYKDTRTLLKALQPHPFWVYLSVDNAGHIQTKIATLIQSKDYTALDELKNQIQDLASKTGLSFNLVIKAINISYSTKKPEIECAYNVYFEDILNKCPHSKKEQLRLLSSCCKELICTSISVSDDVFPPYFTWMLTLAQGLPDELLATMSLENIDAIQYFQDLFTVYQSLSVEHTPETIARSMVETFSISINDAFNEDLLKEECLEEERLFTPTHSKEERELVTQFLDGIENISFLSVAEEEADEKLTQEAIRLIIFLQRKGFDDSTCLYIMKRLLSLERKNTESIEKKIISLQQRVITLPFFSIEREQISLEEIETRIQEKPTELFSDFIKGMLQGLHFHDEKSQKIAFQKIEKQIQQLEKTISTKEETVVSQDEKNVLSLALTHLLQILTINNNNTSFLSDTIDLVHEFIHILATESKIKTPSKKQLALITSLNTFDITLALITSLNTFDITEKNLQNLLQLFKEVFLESTVKSTLFELLIDSTKETYLKKILTKKVFKNDSSPHIVKEVERLTEILILMAPFLLTIFEQAFPHILSNSEKYKEALKSIQNALTSGSSNFPFLVIDKLLPIAKPFIVQIFHYGLLGIIDPQYTKLPETTIEASPISLHLVIEKCCAEPITILSKFLTTTVNALGVQFSSESLQQFESRCPTIASKIKDFLKKKSPSIAFKGGFTAFSIYLKETFRSKGFSPFVENLFSIAEEQLQHIVTITENKPLEKNNITEKIVSNMAEAILDPASSKNPAIQSYIKMLPKMANKLATFQTISRTRGFILFIETGIQLIETAIVEGSFLSTISKKVISLGSRIFTGKSSEDLIRKNIEKYIVAPLNLTQEESKELTNGIFKMLPSLLPLLKIVPELLKKHVLDDIFTDIQFLGNVVAGEKIEQHVLEQRIADLLLKIVMEVNDIERFAIEEGLFAVAQKIIDMS